MTPKQASHWQDSSREDLASISYVLFKYIFLQKLNFLFYAGGL